MAKRHVRRTHHKPVRRAAVKMYRPSENTLVIMRGWMFVVAFALMLGLGALVGQFISNQISTPTVAGVTTQVQ